MNINNCAVYGKGKHWWSRWNLLFKGSLKRCSSFVSNLDGGPNVAYYRIETCDEVKIEVERYNKYVEGVLNSVKKAAKP